MPAPKIWVPPRSDTEPKFICRVCKTQFIGEAAYVRHVTSHSEDDIAEIRAAKKQPVDDFYAFIDPEWEAYNADLRRRGINPEVQYNRGRKSGIRRASES